MTADGGVKNIMPNGNHRKAVGRKTDAVKCNEAIKLHFHYGGSLEMTMDGCSYEIGDGIMLTLTYTVVNEN